MKKETINTFEGGMIKDLHPLTTPNNVLTDALNATLITYNGNENILQNDMGNIKLPFAKLPAGYVPVGMKEHGGIIYVAAYNPKTEKGQIGSFPSPKQLWESENWSINAPKNLIATPNIKGSDFYDGNFIKNEIVKQELFKTEDGKARIFHPGDKFILQLSSKSALQTYVNKGYISIQLGVIKADGSIEIMRTWSKEEPEGSFLYNGNLSDAQLKSLFNSSLNNNIIQVFDASSSGEMILIITLHTLDTFNLYRDYSISHGVENGQASDRIQVTFKGEASRNGETLYSTDSDPNNSDSIKNFLRLSNRGQAETKEIVVYEPGGQNNSTTYEIYPTVPFGIVQRMKKEVTINYDKIRKSEDDFGEWRFFVTDQYLKIGWSYDFYNLNKDKELKYIKMYFHQLEKGYNRQSAVIYEFQKEYYSGNFEDYINISDTGLKPKTVYIVEIVKVVESYNSQTGKNEENEEIICFKMLYLSKLYNDKYNNFFVNNSIGVNATGDSAITKEYSCLDGQTISLDLTYNLDTELESSKSSIQKPGEAQFGSPIDTDKLLNSHYIQEITVDQLNTINNDPESNKNYITKTNNKYECTLKINGKLIDLDDKYIGAPDEKTIVENILNNCTLQSITFQDDSSFTKVGNAFDIKSTPIEPSYTFDFEQQHRSVSDCTLSISDIEISDTRIIEGKASDIQTTTQNSKGLMPLLSPSYTADKKNKVAPYWSLTNLLCISGDADDEESIFYNSTLGQKGEIKEGPDAGGGIDDGGLQTASNFMNNPMTNLFVGMNGDAAEMGFDRLLKDTSSKGQTLASNWGLNTYDSCNSGHIIDDQDDGGGGDNYMIVCWKFTDGQTHFVNLVTSKKGGELNATKPYPRADVILRCLLSQLFVASKVTKSITYITTDDKYYAYQEGKTKIKFTLKYTGNSENLTDIMYSTEDLGREVQPSKTLLGYLKSKDYWDYHDGEIHIDDKGYKLNNLIPSIGLNLPFDSENQSEIELEIPNYYDTDKILQYYFGSVYTPSDEDNSDIDIQAIYAVDTSSQSRDYNIQACNYEEKQGDNMVKALKPRIDGTFEWGSTPKYVAVTGDLKIYKWNDSTQTITFKDFGKHFTTTAKLIGWTSISDEDNEILAIPSEDYAIGTWTNAKEEAGPDMFFKILYSEDLSIYKNALVTNLFTNT